MLVCNWVRQVDSRITAALDRDGSRARLAVGKTVFASCFVFRVEVVGADDHRFELRVGSAATEAEAQAAAEGTAGELIAAIAEAVAAPDSAAP
jgi:hypothetical protein